MRRAARLLLALLTAAGAQASAPASAAELLFEPLGYLPLSGNLGSIPTDVSGSGDVVVGILYNESNGGEMLPGDWNPDSGFRWQAGALLPLERCNAATMHVSDDGNTIAGACQAGALNDPAVWRNGDYQAIALPPAFEGGYISGVSGNGQVYFGNTDFTAAVINNIPRESTEVFRVGGGRSEIVGRIPGDFASYFVASALDGTAAIESRLQSFDEFGGVFEDDVHGARYVGGANGSGLQSLLGGLVKPYDISADGNTLVGQSEALGGGFRWSEGVVEALPKPLGALGVLPMGVSGDGKTIVGMYADEDAKLRACVWTEEDGVRDLQDFVELQEGLDLEGWTLTAATAVSRDGSTIVGYGTSPSWPYPLGWRIGPPPSINMVFGAARMVIPDHKTEEEHEFRRDPAVVTLYGRTVVPITISVPDDDNPGSPLPNTTITVSVAGTDVDVDPAYVGLAFEDDADGGPEELVVNTGSTGEETIYLVVDRLYANVEDGEANATGLDVTATWEDAEKTTTITVEDNRQLVIEKYRTSVSYFPVGARTLLRDSFLPPIDRIDDLAGVTLRGIFQPGNTVVGSVLCNTYQARTLILLNDVRHSDEGWILNGLDYSPLQTRHLDHHFVGLYPHDEPFKTERTRILDPWMAQTNVVYTWLEWVIFMDTPGHGDNVVPDIQQDQFNPGACIVQCGPGQFIPPYYPAAGGRYPYFSENETLPIGERFDACLRIPGPQTPPKKMGWCQRHGFTGSARPLLQVGSTDHTSVVVASPARFLVTHPDGKRFGFTSADAASYVNDFAGEFITAFAAIPEAEGGSGWYVDAPPGRKFRLDFPAFEDGTMDVAVLATDGAVWGGWRDVPITAGQTTGVDVDLDAACPSFAVPGKIGVACERPTACTGDAECASDDPCTPRACVEGVCRNRPVEGLAAATCACDRPRPAACDVPKLPRPLLKTSGKACKLLRSKGMANDKKRTKLLAKAAKSWAAATKALAKRAVTKKTSEACRAALAQRYGDAGARLESLRASQ